MNDSFEQFLTELKQKVKVAEATGMSDKQIADHAAKVGDWLAENYDPKNEEQRLLKELWAVADERQQQAIATTLLKLINKKVPATR